MKHEIGGGIKGTLNQTSHHSGLEETFRLVSFSTYHDVALEELPASFLHSRFDCSFQGQILQ